MTTPASPRPPLSHNARVLLVGVAIVATILGVGKGLPYSVRWYTSTGHTLAAASDRLAERQRAVNSRPNVAQVREQREGLLLSLSPAFLKGTSPSQGAAALASIIADAGEANGVQLASLQPEADSATTTTLIVPVTVRASGNGDVHGIAGMLRDLESGAPLLDVRQLTISQSEPGAAHDRMETLHVELTVRGLYRQVPGDPDTNSGP